MSAPRLWTVRVMREYVALAETAEDAESLWEEAMRDDGPHAQVTARPLRDPIGAEYPLPVGWTLDSLAYGIDDYAGIPIVAAIEIDRETREQEESAP